MMPELDGPSCPTHALMVKGLGTSLAKEELEQHSATSEMISSVRVKTKSGTVSIQIKHGTRVCDLKNTLSNITSIDASQIRILVGFPPKPLDYPNDNVEISSFIPKNETLIVEEIVPRKNSENSCGNVPDDDSACGNSANESQSSSNASGSSPHAYEDSANASALVPSEFAIHESQIISFLPEGVLLRLLMPANNSCLFTSAHFVANNGETNMLEISYLRRVIADWVAADPVHYSDAILGKTNKEYCEWIKNEEHWGGAIELSILCEYFSLEIVVIDKQNKCIHQFGQHLGFDHRVFLMYNGSHYDAVALRSTDELHTIRTIFPVTNEVLLQKAKEISEQPYGVGKMRSLFYICRTCHLKFKTQAEIVVHASKAFHYDFDEN